ncbi:MAG: hypothetical protein L3K08_06510, partial [Thermoplasmata archaeon]|nr:hypothetical protein [Thermoplasmata archaeon]
NRYGGRNASLSGMSLVDATTAVPVEKLRELYQEHRSAIVGLLGTLEAPPSPVVDAARWWNARNLAADLLKLLPEDAASLPVERVTEYVNASYDLALTLVDQLKLALGLPRVPASRR